MPAPDKKIRHFVKREKTIQALDNFLRSSQQIWAADLSGVHGIGKMLPEFLAAVEKVFYTLREKYVREGIFSR